MTVLVRQHFMKQAVSVKHVLILARIVYLPMNVLIVQHLLIDLMFRIVHVPLVTMKRLKNVLNVILSAKNVLNQLLIVLSAILKKEIQSQIAHVN